MATKRVVFEDDLPEEKVKSKKPAPRPSRVGWLASRLFVMLVLLAVLVVFLPTILSATGLWKTILASAAPDIAGKLNAGSLSLAWWSPVTIANLSVRDDAGQPLADVALVRSQKTLLELASGYPDLGTFEIIEPRASVVLRQDGSNIEDFLAKLPKDESDGGGGAPVTIGLVLTRGTVGLDDTVAGRQWSLENVNLDLAWPTANDQPKSGKLTATVSSPAVPAGQAPQSTVPSQPMSDRDGRTTIGDLAAGFSWQSGSADKMTMGAGQAEVKLSGFPTELLEGALRRFVSDIRPQGGLTLDATYVWTDDGKSQQLLVRQLAAPQLVVASPELLGNDRIGAAIETGQADVLLAGGKIDIKQLALVSNLMQVSGKGAASLAAPTDASDVEVTAQIDLAQLARQLPGTLRLKQDTQLQSGVVQVTLANRQEAGGRRWQGSLRTDRIQAVAAGRPIQFDEPLAIDFAVRLTDDGPVIDQLVGKSSFLRLNGSGALAQGSITADADLDRLVAELGQLIDWRDIQLAGTLGAKVDWNRGANGVWTAQASARVQNFVAAAAGMAPWRETDLQVGADVTGVLTGASLQSIDRAKLTVISAGDRLEANLTEPVKELSATAAWPLAFSVQGDLSTWMPRLQPVVPLAGWQFAGRLDAKGAGRFSPAVCQLAPTTAQVEHLEVAGPGLWIREPIARLTTSGIWDQTKMALTLPSTTLESTSLALRADEIHLTAAAQPTVTGLIDFRGDPARLSEWIGSKDAPRTWQIGGELTGRIEIADRGPAHEATLNAGIERFVFLTATPASPPQGPRAALASRSAAPAMQTTWAESKVTLTGQASYDPAAGTLAIARSGLLTDWAQIAATGKISELTTRCLTDLSGEISYDLALVEKKIKHEIFPRGPNDDPKVTRSIDTLSLQGQEKRPFTLKGPLLSALPASAGSSTATGGLVPTELVGEASLGWQAAQYVGLIAGPADFKAQLQQGVVSIGPLDIPVSDGRLTTAPRILLNEPVPQLVVDRGPLIQNVRITPEMCNQWLKYVAPLLADATAAEGKFSLDLQRASVPLFAPMTSTVQGSLAIQGAQVGPGPLAKQYLGMARQVKSIVDPTAAAGDNYGRWLLLPEHKVNFAVQDGLVAHDGLTMTAQNFAVTTSGHVRIADQAIDLNANIPIQQNWFKKEQQSLAAGLKGKSIPVKVAGTLSQPRLDGKSLTNFGQQLAGSAVQGFLDKNTPKVQGLIDKEAGKLLDGLFGPKPKPAATTPAPAPMR
jgi:translocation and assembly module TamB